MEPLLPAVSRRRTGPIGPISKVILYEDAAGRVHVCTPFISTDDADDFTEKDALQRALAKDIPADARRTSVKPRSKVPQDRTFRAALKLNLKHDIAKCREIWKDEMRRARAPKLAALDVEYQRADEAGNAEAKVAVAKRKQALRDVTAHPKIAKAKTPEQLKAIWPEILK
jgi:hypothetical protein